jgi:acetyl esterase/lipase
VPFLAAALACLLLAAPAAAADRFYDEVFTRVDVDLDRAYGDDPQQQLDVYAPHGDRRARRPAMVWVHGGGFASGSRQHPTLRKLALGSARRGYVALSVDYRILSESGCEVSEPGCRAIALQDLSDVQAAIRWLRAHADRYRVDTSRIAVGGTSVGGILAYLVGTNPAPGARVRAFVSIAGGWPGPDGGGFLGAGDAPGLLFHGTADRVTPFAWSVDATRALRAAGVPATLVRIPRGQHVAYDVYRELYDRRSHSFVARRLGL